MAKKKTTKIKSSRPSIAAPVVSKGMWFDEEVKPDTFTTGCTLLDCTIGGGWGEGRVINVVGDQSTGKTLLAIEAAANFLRKYPKGEVDYTETEAAFDIEYAQRVGLPLKRVTFPPDIYTIQDLFKHWQGKLKNQPKYPQLWIVDSFDALSEDKEMASEVTDGTYGTGKAKMASRLFRQLVQQLRNSNITLMVISQTRDKIGVTFGKTKIRGGGKALDFYASQIVWLAHIKRLKRTRLGQEKSYGVIIKAKVEKNKVGNPFGECDFPILFNYGIDDVAAGVTYLKSTKRLKLIGVAEKQAGSYAAKVLEMDDARFTEHRSKINEAVISVYNEVRELFKPPRSKYGTD